MRVAILDDYARVARAFADWDGCGDVTVFHDTLPMGDALVARLRPFDVVCLMRERTPFPAALINALPNLKLIVSAGPRNASIDTDAAARAGIVVRGTQSRKTTTAELTLLLMLALNRKLVPNVTTFQDGGWQGPLGRDLAGLTLGVIGLGTIGAQVAVLAQALGMNVCAWSQNLTAARAQECHVQFMPDLHALLARSDVVSVHLVHSERTNRVMNAQAFAAMKAGSVFINTSRAGLVDTDALLHALQAGTPAAAALDVFDQEPLPAPHRLRDETLIAQGKLLLTPHLGYATEATLRLFYTQMADAIRDWSQGTPGPR